MARRGGVVLVALQAVQDGNRTFGAGDQLRMHLPEQVRLSRSALSQQDSPETGSLSRNQLCKAEGLPSRVIMAETHRAMDTRRRIAWRAIQTEFGGTRLVLPLRARKPGGRGL